MTDPLAGGVVAPNATRTTANALRAEKRMPNGGNWQTPRKLQRCITRPVADTKSAIRRCYAIGCVVAGKVTKIFVKGRPRTLVGGTSRTAIAAGKTNGHGRWQTRTRFASMPRGVTRNTIGRTPIGGLSIMLDAGHEDAPQVRHGFERQANIKPSAPFIGRQRPPACLLTTTYHSLAVAFVAPWVFMYLSTCNSSPLP